MVHAVFADQLVADEHNARGSRGIGSAADTGAAVAGDELALDAESASEPRKLSRVTGVPPSPKNLSKDPPAPPSSAGRGHVAYSELGGLSFSLPSLQESLQRQEKISTMMRQGYEQLLFEHGRDAELRKVEQKEIERRELLRATIGEEQTTKEWVRLSMASKPDFRRRRQTGRTAMDARIASTSSSVFLSKCESVGAVPYPQRQQESSGLFRLAKGESVGAVPYAQPRHESSGLFRLAKGESVGAAPQTRPRLDSCCSLRSQPQGGDDNAHDLIADLTASTTLCEEGPLAHWIVRTVPRELPPLSREHRCRLPPSSSAASVLASSEQEHADLMSLLQLGIATPEHDGATASRPLRQGRGAHSHSAGQQEPEVRPPLLSLPPAPTPELAQASFDFSLRHLQRLERSARALKQALCYLEQMTVGLALIFYAVLSQARGTVARANVDALNGSLESLRRNRLVIPASSAAPPLLNVSMSDVAPELPPSIDTLCSEFIALDPNPSSEPARFNG